MNIYILASKVVAHRVKITSQEIEYIEPQDENL